MISQYFWLPINIEKQTTHQVIGEELKYMEEAEDHPVSEPSEFKRWLFFYFWSFEIPVFFLLLLCHEGSVKEGVLILVTLVRSESVDGIDKVGE